MEIKVAHIYYGKIYVNVLPQKKCFRTQKFKGRVTS